MSQMRASVLAIQTWFNDPAAANTIILPEDDLHHAMLKVLEKYGITRSPWTEHPAGTAQLVVGSTPGPNPWVRSGGDVRRAQMMADALQVPPVAHEIYLASDSTCGLYKKTSGRKIRWAWDKMYMHHAYPQRCASGVMPG